MLPVPLRKRHFLPSSTGLLLWKHYWGLIRFVPVRAWASQTTPPLHSRLLTFGSDCSKPRGVADRAEDLHARCCLSTVSEMLRRFQGLGVREGRETAERTGPRFLPQGLPGLPNFSPLTPTASQRMSEIQDIHSDVSHFYFNGSLAPLYLNPVFDLICRALPRTNPASLASSISRFPLHLRLQSLPPNAA